MNRVVISSKEDGIVCELKEDTQHAQIGQFTLHTGRNSAQSIRMDTGSLRTVVSDQDGMFLLRPGTEYRIRIWNGVGSSSEWFTLDQAGSIALRAMAARCVVGRLMVSIRTDVPPAEYWDPFACGSG